MYGGIFQLVASSGIETLYLIGDPQITLFKTIYRRHTEFTLLDKRQNFNNKITFGSATTHVMNNVADITHGMMLVVDLPKVSLKFQVPSVANVAKILSDYGIKWNHSYNSSDTVTLDIYTDEIIPIIDNKLAINTNEYKYYNDVLSILDSKYDKKPNVFDGEYYILNSNVIQTDIMLLPYYNFGLTIEDRQMENRANNYVFIDTKTFEFDENAITLTLNPNNDLFKNSDGSIFHCSKSYLTLQERYNASGLSQPTARFVAVLKSAITGDWSSTKTINANINNIYKPNGTVVKFQGAIENKITVGKQLIRFNTDGDDNVILYDIPDHITDEFYDTYFFYEAGGAGGVGFDAGVVTIDINDTSKVLTNVNGGGVFYMSENWIKKFNIDNESNLGYFIAVNRRPFEESGLSVMDIDLDTYGYKVLINNAYKYRRFKINQLPANSEIFYCAISNKRIVEVVEDGNPKAYFTKNDIVQKDNDVIYISKRSFDEYVNNTDEEINTYALKSTDYDDSPNYLYSVNVNQMTPSQYTTTGIYNLIKKSDVTNNDDGTISFPKTAIAKTLNDASYDSFTIDIATNDILVDKTITEEDIFSNNKLGVDNLSDIDYYQGNSYPFLLQTMKFFLKMDESASIPVALYDGLTSLFKDVASDINRNITLNNIRDIVLGMYSKYIQLIFNITRIYGDNYFTNPEHNPVTTKTIVRSNAKPNIVFYHVLDMGDYDGIPFKSSIVEKFFDHILSESYNTTDQYTSLDSFVTYTNYINENKDSIEFIDPSGGYHDHIFLEYVANQITDHIRYNYSENNTLFSRILDSVENVSNVHDSEIRLSVVFKSDSINSNISTQRDYGLLNHSNNIKHKTNIIDNVVKVGNESDVSIYYKNNIKSYFASFVDGVRSVIADQINRDYFDKTIYWNECMPVSRISGIESTAMNRTLSMDIDSGISMTYDNYITAFGDSRVIMSHIPYALVQGLPYAVETIILNGDLMNPDSDKFFLSDVLSEYRELVVQSFKDYMNLYLGDNFVTRYLDGEGNQIDKVELIESIENDMFHMVIGADRRDPDTYYHKEYINNLVSTSDGVDSIYIVVPFFIEAIGTLDAIPNSNFAYRTDTTPTEFICRKFRRTWYTIMNDFVDHVNNGYFTDNDDNILTFDDLTGGDVTTMSFNTHLDTVWDAVSLIMFDHWELNMTEESTYARNLTLYTDEEIFSNLRDGEHNYKFMDIQSSIWHIIQKKNIRLYNELFYDGILSLDNLKSIGGNNLLGFYDDFITIVDDDSDAPTIYNDSYTDAEGNIVPSNYLTNSTDLTPTGRTGIDFYRLRSTGTYSVLQKKMTDDAKYFNYLLNSRYNRLKEILNIKNINLSQQTYTYESRTIIIADLATKLLDEYDIESSDYSSTMLSLIGYQRDADTSTFINSAKSLNNTMLTVYDIITDGDVNDEDNIYAKLYRVFDSPTVNPFDDVSDSNLYNWFELYNESINMQDVFNYLSSIINTINPTMLHNNIRKNTAFNYYEKYTDAILVILDTILINNVTTFKLYKDLKPNYSDEIKFYDDIVNICISNIESNGDVINNLVNFTDGSTTYKEEDSRLIDGVIWEFRYKYIDNLNVNIDDSILLTYLNNVIENRAPKFKYVKELGNRLIKKSTIRFDSQIISEVSDIVLSHISRTRIGNDNRRGYDIMIGNTSKMQEFTPYQKPIKRLYIPLKHYFDSRMNGIGSSIPNVALLHTDIFHDLSLRELDDIIIKEAGSTFVRTPRIKCHLLNSHAYVEKEERQKLAKAKMEYLVPRYIDGGEHTISKKDLYETNKIRIIMRFGEPTKYIYWKIGFQKMTQTQQEIDDSKFDWINQELKNEFDEYVMSMDECKIKFSGRDREGYKDYNWFNAYHPWTKGIDNLEPGEFVYSFALDPLKFQPSGSASLKNVGDIVFIMKLHDKAVEALNNGYVMTIRSFAHTSTILAVMSGMGGLRFHSQ